MNNTERIHKDLEVFMKQQKLEQDNSEEVISFPNSFEMLDLIAEELNIMKTKRYKTKYKSIFK